MEKKSLEITIVSASDLEDVRSFFKMKVYAEVSMSNNPSLKKQTPVDKERGINPIWNHTMKFINIPESDLQRPDIYVFFELKCKRKVKEHKCVGHVSVPIKELLHKADNPGAVQLLTCPIKAPAGNSNGMLKFSYKFGEDIAVYEAPTAPPPQNNQGQSSTKMRMEKLGKCVAGAAVEIGTSIVAVCLGELAEEDEDDEGDGKTNEDSKEH